MAPRFLLQASKSLTSLPAAAILAASGHPKGRISASCFLLFEKSQKRLNAPQKYLLAAGLVHFADLHCERQDEKILFYIFAFVFKPK